MTNRRSPERSGIVTLLTDFGLEDAFVGAMKGVVLGIFPGARLADLTHGVAAHNILEGAFGLAGAAPYFPAGTVHVAVVDPGVGSDRRAIVAECERGLYVAPDNGLLTLVLRQDPPKRIVAIEDARYRLPGVSATFHGRDIFAPAGAHLAVGVDAGEFGPELSSITYLDVPRPHRRDDGGVEGAVLHVDHFGNCIANIPNDWLFEQPDWEVAVDDTRLHGIRTAYAAVEPGEPLAVWGSSGFLEIAIRDGNAAETLDLHVGSRLAALPR